MTSTKRPHVLILGAGLGGLTLAQALRKQGVTFEIFERDAGLHARSQGWAIALHQMLKDFKASMPDDLGAVEMTSHLKPLDLPAQFTLFRNREVVARVTSGEGNEIVRANRSRLRDYLSAHLDINWDKHCTDIEERGNKVVLHFGDGTSAIGDVLVGADGVHSKVRSYLYNGADQLRDLPFEIVGWQTTLNKEQYERQMRISNSAYVATMGGSVRVFVGLNSVDPDAQHAHYYWFWTRPSSETEKAKQKARNASKQEQLDRAMQEMEALGPEHSEIAKLSRAERMVTPSIVLRDIELGTMPNRRVTLLGDAAHAMAPHRGEGGNHAMQDALNLARALAHADSDEVLPYLKEYQDEMLERSSKAVRNSRAATGDDGSLSAQGWSAWTKPLNGSSKSAIEAH